MAIAAYGLRHPGHINRLEGGLLLAAFFAYQGWIVYSV